MSRVITPIPLTRSEDELRAGFAALQTRGDVARLLEVSDQELFYILYREGKKYIEFDVPKKSGGSRHIAAPTSSIKYLQKRVNQVLRLVYNPKAPVHGFALNRGIITNADRHIRKRVVLNLDLRDFFPSIHFGRVRGVFSSPPYNLPKEAAQTLAQICTHNRILPQGAPTSPIISNMVCVSLDSGLRRLAADHGCTYTRYADDITISTTRNSLPRQIAYSVPDSKGNLIIHLGDALRDVIQGNSFVINEKKVRLRTTGQRFEVTGLVVHKGVNVPREYVRNLRGLLHAWERYGYEGAEAGLQERHHRKHRRPGSPLVKLLDVAAGKLEFLRMVRGGDDFLYTALWNRFAALAGPPYEPKTALVQTLEKIQSALWLLESADPEDPSVIRIGTAFVLDGQSLVTCAHCLGRAPIIAYQPGPLVTQRVATVTHRADDLDLARLSLDVPVPSALKRTAAAFVQPGTQTIVAGFGNYAPGSASRMIRGHVTGGGVRHGIPVIYSDHRVFAGNSGGPVLNEALQVIGVLQRGITPEAPDQETTILPVSLLARVPPAQQARADNPGDDQ